ncbi:insulin-like peptide INSL5 [Echinops telfairi]|uniref:Insulin-like peptide INSL5 n=1 Tax=Echinops telfairi TaxID=9371 RepID=A0ABM0IGP4_ECHTE|nr:insulin-like peptide INSL5 [Echinops telfairi]
MKGSIVTLFFFFVLLASPEVQSEGMVKLCGRNFIRAVIFLCGASRWRRHPEGSLQLQQAERGNHFHDPNEQEISAETRGQSLQQLESAAGDGPQGGQLPVGRRWESRQHPVKSKRELLLETCCNIGCSKAELSTICSSKNEHTLGGRALRWFHGSASLPDPALPQSHEGDGF